MRKTWYDLGKEHLTSFNMGEIIPIMCKEVLPGDEWHQESIGLLRTLPLSKPLMQRVNADIIHFYVPTRILWDDFPDFITGGPDGNAEPEFPTIEVPAGGFPVGSLGHHLGVCPAEGDGLFISALRFRAMALCFNHWFRNQAHVAPVNVSTASGVDTTTNTDLLMAMWEKDFVTTLMDEPQLGTQVVVPLLGTAPVVGQNMPFDNSYSGDNFVNVRDESGNLRAINGNTVGNGVAGRNAALGTGELVTDLSAASGVSVIQNRIANYMQRFKETKSMEGAEYKDALRQLGVRFSDASLQLPQRLGKSSAVMQFSEVLATAQSTGVEIGDLKGHGIGGIRTKGFKQRFEEWGYVLSFIIVRPKTGYMQMMDRDWFYQTKYDMWQRGFEHVGAEEVLNKQIRLGHNSPEGIFGWGVRYDGLRYSENTIAGEFYSTEKDWHQFRDLPVDVALNASAVTANPTDRIFPVERRNADQIKAQIIHKVNVKRLISPNTNNYIK